MAYSLIYPDQLRVVKPGRILTRDEGISIAAFYRKREAECVTAAAKEKRGKERGAAQRVASLMARAARLAECAADLEQATQLNGLD